MILENNIVRVGSTQKPYGIKGEIVMLFSSEKYAEVNTNYYFLMIDGVPVPFYIEEFTATANNMARVKFEDIDNEILASKYVNLEVYLPRDLVGNFDDNSDSDWHLFIGYEVVDEDYNLIGVIKDVDESTINILFILSRSDDSELLIPATEDFIYSIDEENKVLEMKLPEGLITD